MKKPPKLLKKQEETGIINPKNNSETMPTAIGKQIF
jgi:hypothetical protein